MKTYIPDSKKLDGKQLYYSFLAGAQRVFDNQSHLNKINVFPVPDADTGTNLASTMRAIVDSSIPTENIKITAEAIADAALVGARGNSGIIFAQFLYGFSNEIKNEAAIDVSSFAEIIKKSAKYSYEAISNPVEGTMITVIREWADHIDTIKDKFDDFKHLITESLSKAKQSLKETTEKLEVLAKANVVDAGAKGFVCFLEGMIDFFKHEQIKRVLSARNIIKVQAAEVEHISHDVITYRYCTEAMLSGDSMDKHNIATNIKYLGDSLVIAGSPSKLRIHIHTDDPAELFEKLYNYGNISYQKVDDMVMQYEIMENRKNDIALVTDSTCDLPDELLEKHQIQMIPLTVHLGDNYYLDRLTIKADKFYKTLQNLDIRPTTAQPAFKDFSNRYNYLSTHYDSIIAMNLSGAMSGTWSNSKKAAKTIGLQVKKDISVIDSKRLTGGLGLMVLRMAEAIESKKYAHAELVDLAEKWVKKSNIYVSVTTMKYIVKSGRVSPLKGFIGNLLGLKPVITVNDEGKTELMEKSFTEHGSIKKILKHSEAIAKKGKIWGYAITDVENPSTAKYFEKELSKLFGMPPKFKRTASPVLGANTGPGVVCISILEE